MPKEHDWIDRIAGLTPSIMAAVAVLTVVQVGYVIFSGGIRNRLPSVTEPEPSIKSLQADLDKIKTQQGVFDKTLATIRGPSERYTALNPVDRQAINEIIQGQKNLSDRLKALEDALRLDVAKSLAVPILRKDLDSLQDKTRSDLVLVQNELGRLFSLAQWLVGLVFTIVLGFLTLVVANFLKKGKEELEPARYSSQIRQN